MLMKKNEMPISFDSQISDALAQLEAYLPGDIRTWADAVEQEGAYPFEALRAVHELGLLHAGVSRHNGGLGGGVRDENPGLYLQVIRTLGAEDSAAAHCFQVHNHALMKLDQFGTPWQIENILRPLVQKQSFCGAVGAEPARRSKNQPFSTVARKVDGGWVIDGLKIFVTNGGVGDLYLTAVALDPEQNGGATAKTFIALIERDMPGVSWDDDWYRPNGMKAARSPKMILEGVFVPDTHILWPDPAREKELRWQRQIHLGFAANYLGGAEGIHKWCIEYAKQRGGTGNPFQHVRVGKLSYRLAAAAALFEQAIESWTTKTLEEAELLSISAKVFAAETTSHIIQETLPGAGATAQFENQPYGRYLRNMHLHLVHMGFDQTAEVLGRAQFGLDYDPTILR